MSSSNYMERDKKGDRAVTFFIPELVLLLPSVFQILQ